MLKNQIIYKQLNHVAKLEKTFLNQNENTFIKNNMQPVIDKLQEKIPEKVKTTLDLTFYKGFQFVFEKGNAYIEKTYDKDSILLEHDLNNYAVDKYMSKKHLKNMNKKSNQSKTLNQSISFLEGGVLGLFGIGLPDIPLFISVILRTINEIALAYGYQYNTNEEKIFIMYIICGSMTKGETLKEYDEMINLLGKNIDTGNTIDCNLEDVMKETSQVLSNSLLLAKVIQGIPVVGVLGGIVNPAIISNVGKYANLKYKKRYLLRKIQE
ncbi:MAG: EcsC family protein [Lachnotalea sp.]